MRLKVSRGLLGWVISSAGGQVDQQGRESDAIEEAVELVRSRGGGRVDVFDPKGDLRRSIDVKPPQRHFDVSESAASLSSAPTPPAAPQQQVALSPQVPAQIPTPQIPTLSPPKAARALRKAISNPPELNLAPSRTEPLRFFIADEPPPKGMDSEVSPDGRWVFSAYPWGGEQSYRIRNDPRAGYIIRYVFRIPDTGLILAHCLGSFFETYYQYMIGRDFGDHVTPLIAHRWPKTFELLFRGSQGLGWPALARFTTSEPQWAVATVLEASDPDAIVEPSLEDTNSLFNSTMESLGELLGAEQLLSELVVIFGGDDYTTRRLKTAMRILKMASGGLDDLSNIADAFRDISRGG